MKNYIVLVLLSGSMLLSAMEVDKKDLNSKLWLAAEAGSMEDCKVLIAQGADTNGLSSYNCSVLTIAASNGHKTVCELLISHKADVNFIKKNDVWTVLMYAAQSGHKEVCELLIAKGAAVNPEGINFSPLMAAVKLGNENRIVCEFLLEMGAEVTVANKDGRTAPLRSAMWGRDKNINELLLIHRLLRGSSRITKKEAKERLFTTFLVLEQKIKMGHLPQDLLLVIISELRDDLFTLVANLHGNMDKFPHILQKIVADYIISFLLSEEGKKLLEEAQKNADIYEIKNLFNIEGVLNIFPGQLGVYLEKSLKKNTLEASLGGTK